MENEQQGTRHKPEPQSRPIRVFFDGAGSRPNGDGSGYAWICPDSNEKAVRRVPGLTNNQAEYRGFLAALEQIPTDGEVEIFSDSQLICSQFDGKYRVKDETLQALLSEVRSVITEKRLKVTLTWVPRSRNLAGKLL
jgi:ribonuclease HI